MTKLGARLLLLLLLTSHFLLLTSVGAVSAQVLPIYTLAPLWVAMAMTGY